MPGDPHLPRDGRGAAAFLRLHAPRGQVHAEDELQRSATVQRRQPRLHRRLRGHVQPADSAEERHLVLPRRRNTSLHSAKVSRLLHLCRCRPHLCRCRPHLCRRRPHLCRRRLILRRLSRLRFRRLRLRRCHRRLYRRNIKEDELGGIFTGGGLRESL